MEQVLQSLCYLYFKAIRQRHTELFADIENLIHEIQATKFPADSRISPHTYDLLYQVYFLRQFRKLSVTDRKTALQKFTEQSAFLKPATTTAKDRLAAARKT